MADHHQFPIGVKRAYLVDRHDDAPLHIFVAFAALRPPEPSALWVVAGVLAGEIAQEVVRLALEHTKVALVQVMHDFDRESQLARDNFAGLPRAAIGTRDDPFGREALGDTLSRFAGLLTPQLGERYLRRNCEAAIAI